MKLLKFPVQDLVTMKAHHVYTASKLLHDQENAYEFQQIFLDALLECYSFDDDFYADNVYRKILEAQEWIRQFHQKEDDALEEMVEQIEEIIEKEKELDSQEKPS